MHSRFETVYLARHGETEWNRECRRQGQLDSPLTERGRMQAAAAGEALGGCAIGAVFHSPLGRAAETAEIVAELLSLPTFELADLAEVHHGDMAGLSEAQIDKRFPGAFEERDRDKYIWAFPRGESYADAELRATAALNAIADTGTRRPLIVSHEMIGRMLLKQLLGLEPRAALAERQPNNVVHVVAPRSADRSTIVT